MAYDLRLKGYVGGWDFDSDYVDYILDKYPDREVTVMIDSTGGSLKTGLSILAAFRAHGNVSVHFVGLNASAATIASLGAKRITMDAASAYLVHKTSVPVLDWANLNSDQIEERCKELLKTKQNLDQLDLVVAKAYAQRCKRDVKDLQDLMKQETWLTAQEALDWGFIDEITDAPEDAAPILDQVTADAFAASGIPVPGFISRKQDPKDSGESIVTSIVNSIKSIFKQTPMETPANHTTPAGTTGTPAAAPAEAAAQSTEAATAAPATATGTPAAAPAEAAAKSTEDLLAEKDARIAELEAKLAKQPAEAHARVIETAKTDRENYFASLKSANDLFDSLP